MRKLFTITFFILSFSALAVDPGGGGGGGPVMHTGNNIIILNGKIKLSAELFNQQNIYHQLAQTWQLDKIKIISKQAVAISEVAEIEYINNDYLLTDEIEQKIVVPAASVRTIHLMNGEQIKMTKPMMQYEVIEPVSAIIQAAQEVQYETATYSLHTRSLSSTQMVQ